LTPGPGNIRVLAALACLAGGLAFPLHVRLGTRAVAADVSHIVGTLMITAVACLRSPLTDLTPLLYTWVVTTAFTGSGEPRASIGATATLTSVAAVVLGGVALLGGSGTLLGPVLAAFCLSLIPALMLGLGWDPNYAEVARGIIIIVVVMIGGLVQVPRRSR